MQRKGSLDNQMLYYTVKIIALLNLIAYFSMGDWHSVGWFVVSGACMFGLSSNKSIALLVAILGGALSRCVYMEGMTKKSKPKLDELKDIMNGANLEGLTQNADKLVKRQKDLFHMANKMGPLMKQASDMMKQLPEGFLESAMKKLNKRKSNDM
jgi:uncharacterized protein YoxC